MAACLMSATDVLAQNVGSDSSNDIMNATGNPAIGANQTIIGSGVSGKVFDMVDTMPGFPGGQSALMQYLSNNVRYPVECEKGHIQGRVICSFIVETDGSISDVTVVRSVHRLLDAESIRVLRNMPKWTAGKLKDGTAVRVKYTVPISYKL